MFSLIFLHFHWTFEKSSSSTSLVLPGLSMTTGMRMFVLFIGSGMLNTFIAGSHEVEESGDSAGIELFLNVESSVSSRVGILVNMGSCVCSGWGIFLW